MTNTLDNRSQHHGPHGGQSDPGFTLIEIVIAIVLVGILSAVAVVGISSLTGKGSAAACTSSLDSAKAATVAYYANNTAYPTTLLAMTTSTPKTWEVPNDVAVTSAAPTVATGNGWTLTMTPGSAGAAPTFSCDTGASGSSGTAAVGTTACPGAYTGWVGEYYSNVSLTGAPTVCRDDASLAFNWGAGAPATGVPADNFSIRWTKTVTFTAGTYNFTVGSDDGSRVYVDGTLLINYWTDHGYGTMSGSRPITAGTHTIVMEFYERGGVTQSSLTWV